jgi:hypothetical protein
MERPSQIQSQEALILELRNSLGSHKSWLLGVDGEQRVGKTTLSGRLAAELQATKLSGDDFVRQGRLHYPEALGLSELSNAIANLRATNKPVILESVMLQLILDSIGIKPDLTVYVRHSAFDGKFTHSHLFDPALLKAAIEEDKAINECFFQDRKTPTLTSEILAYHQVYLPNENSDYVFTNRF